jgi:hypothetical protein
MRRLLIGLLLCLMCSSLWAQQPQRGRIKSFDTEKGAVSITTPEGATVEAAIVPQTMFRDASNQDIAGAREKGIPVGTTVMFRAEERGGKTVLVGMRVPGDGAGQPKADGQPKAGGQANAKGQKGNFQPPPPPRDSVGVKPLTELGSETYKGESGGLYGNGSNDPPAQQQEAAKKAIAKIQALDAQGKPSASGKIGLVSIGMSNTTMEFSNFVKLANSDAQKSDKVVVVDLAQGGKIPVAWNDPNSEMGKQVWGIADQRLKAADVSHEQVQVAWVKQALAGQAQYGEFPAHAHKLENDLVTSLQVIKKQFPNLQLAFLSSRIYGGYATTGLNPEPYAYEGAFSMRWIIDRQMKGDAALNWDPAKGEVKAPVALWGPYLWGDGMTPRKDGTVWTKDDLTDRDGTHPSPSGQKKVAEMLVKFFHTDPNAKGWYLK